MMMVMVVMKDVLSLAYVFLRVAMWSFRRRKRIGISFCIKRHFSFIVLFSFFQR